MNANVSESGSLYGKMIAMFIAPLFVISSFSLLVSASSDEEQESNITEGIILGEALVQNIVSNEGVKAVSEFNPVPADVDTTIPLASTMATGWFSPAREPFGASKVFLMDDDAENWMSGPWLEAAHIETALNDGGYSYDVFRAGSWGGTNKALPSGATGLSMVADYEVVIWYSGWNTQIL